MAVFHGFHLREIELAERDVAVAGDSAVERGPRRGERRRHGFTLACTRHPLGEQGDSAGDQTGNSCGPCDDGHESADRDVESSGVARALGIGIHESRRIRFEAAQLSQDVCAGDTVGGAVVDFRHDGDLPVGEALDDPHLPQRAGPIQRLAGDVSGKFRQFRVRSRRGYRGPMAMPLDVEIVVVDPDRVVEIEARIFEFAPEGRHGGHPRVQLAEELPVVVAARNGCRVEQDKSTNVQ
ncbi:hypothetical protein GCM10020255_077580 [Rhodococcus baikonurensis]